MKNFLLIILGVIGVFLTIFCVILFISIYSLGIENKFSFFSNVNFLENINFNNNEKTPDTKELEVINIYSSIIPISSITNYIGGEFVNVNNGLDEGESPHDFLKKVDYNKYKKDIVSDIENSDLIIYTGFEDIDLFNASDIFSNKNTLNIKNISDIELLSENNINLKNLDDIYLCLKKDSLSNCSVDYLKINNTSENKCNLIEDDIGVYCEYKFNVINPHLWLSSNNLIKIAEEITKELSFIKPSESYYFKVNLKEFSRELTNSKKIFLQNIKTKKQSKFIVFHDDYDYLFKELNIDIKNKTVFQDILNSDNHEELDILLNELIDGNITTGFTEPQYSSDGLIELLNGFNADIYKLDPLGSDISSYGIIKNYRSNLDNLLNIYK